MYSNNKLPLYLRIKNYLSEIIADNLENESYKLPSENQLALKFGTSRITAKNALDELVKEGAVIRIQGKGSFINPKHTIIPRETVVTLDKQLRKIYIIIPDHSEFVDKIVTNINSFFIQKDIMCAVICSYQDQKQEEHAIRNALDSGADGLIVYPIDRELYNQEIVKLSFSNFPIVLVDRKLPGLNFNFVTNDHFATAYDITTAFIERGHKQICFICQESDQLSSITERLNGYRTALLENGIKESYFLPHTAVKEYSDTIRQEIYSYLKDKPYISAFIVSSDLLVLILAQVLTSLNRDIKDCAFAQYIETIPEPFNPNLTQSVTVKQFPEKIGETAANILYDQLSGNRNKQHITIPHELMRIENIPLLKTP